MSPKEKLQQLLSYAGIQINGTRDYDIQVHDERVYSEVLSRGSLALGETYMDGLWDVKHLDQFFTLVLKNNLANKIGSWRSIFPWLRAKLINLQGRSRAFEVGEKHYDIGNKLYSLMLDERMIYSCAYWKDAETLDEAQEAKLDLICRKTRLKPGMRVLDLGCGWGGFAKYAAENYGVEVVGITVSEEQARLAEATCEGLPIEIKVQDYRELNEEFDVIISIGMFEHVGVKNYRDFMEVVYRCLADDGLFLLHTIGSERETNSIESWMERYIFPNAMLPSPRQISKSSRDLFVLEDWHNFGADYDKTLMAWYENFVNSWDELKEDYDEKFYRMWTYYLLSCAGSFRSRYNQLWQIVFSKNGVEGGYEYIR